MMQLTNKHKTLQSLTRSSLGYININLQSLFVCLSDHNYNPLDRFASNLDWETWENYRNVLSLVLRFLFKEKTSKNRSLRTNAGKRLE